jgi:hypothetical protein
MVFGLAVRDRDCDTGDAPPAIAENDNDAGLTVGVLVAAETDIVTGTLTHRSSP